MVLGKRATCVEVAAVMHIAVVAGGLLGTGKAIRGHQESGARRSRAEIRRAAARKINESG